MGHRRSLDHLDSLDHLVSPLLLTPLSPRGVRERDDLPAGTRLEQLKGIDAAVAEFVAEVEVVFRPYRGERAVDAHFGPEHPLIPRLGRAGQRLDELGDPRQLHARLAIAGDDAREHRPERAIAVSRAFIASHRRCTTATTAARSSGAAVVACPWTSPGDRRTRPTSARRNGFAVSFLIPRSPFLIVPLSHFAPPSRPASDPAPPTGASGHEPSRPHAGRRCGHRSAGSHRAG